MPMHYAFYVSYPVIDQMVDLNNPAHVKLIKFYKSIKPTEFETITKPEARKMRTLMKAAGLVDNYNTTGECGIYSIDLSFRVCKYPTMPENQVDLPANCQWVSVQELS